MFGGGKRKPIEETTTKDIWFSLFFGTIIGGGILVSSFFLQGASVVFMDYPLL